jgi:hypothetical protein
MIVGATYLPPDFFQNNPNTVVVGSRDNSIDTKTNVVPVYKLP